MAQLFGTNELQSFVAYMLRVYVYAYDTEADLFFYYLMQDLLFHSKLMIKLK
jgi:hypothetical protein